MSVNKRNPETGELVVLASGARMWVGTKLAHDAAIAAGTMPNNCMVCLTDDYGDATVDAITVGDMHPVTSNAVANYITNLSGTFDVTIPPDEYINTTITFPQTLPNTDYLITFESTTAGSVLFTVMNRDVDTVYVNVRNLNTSELAITCKWYLMCKN